ncbi:ABC transporter substrate-binding protein [Algoriphagus sp.]|uniref:ABC transporter substrate-binding protein n=1 Tax=Algoriphagus sp. TaxID=1872435 RepID=UPI00262BA071|nr:ABC transporter substrate-binding protein [Algoriphagus sp.]
MQKLVFLFAFFLVSIQLSAQNLPQGYERGKVLLNSRSYAEAISAFEPLMNSDEYGNLANYAKFYAATAALELSRTEEAIGWLQPLVSQTWTHQNESKFLLAKAYFQNQQAAEALRLVLELQKTDLNESVQNMVYDYLVQRSPDFLTRNIREFQEIPAYRAALSTILTEKNVLSSDERSLYYELKGMGITGTEAKIKDQILDLVVILPFTDGNNSRLERVDPSSFTYELFQGIRLGVSQLRKEGVKVNLISFDSKRDLAHLRNILEDPAVAQADLIIGPIYPEEADLVSAFAENAQIPFIHPLSNLADRFEDRAFSFLFRPSVSDLVDGVVSNLKGRNWGKRIAIGYSGSTRDVQMSELLTAKLAQEGFDLVAKMELNPGNAAKFLTDLRVLPSRDSADVRANQVIVLTDDPSIAQPTLSYIESVTANVPILVMDSWLGFNFANYEMLEFPNFFFISNNTPRFDSQEMEDFRQDFYDRYLIFPSINAILGSELIHWVGANFSSSTSGTLRDRFAAGEFLPGKLTWGFDFKDSNSNQFVPVFGMEAGELKPIN